MNGTRAKKLRKLARRYAYQLNPKSPPVEQCYRAAKLGLKRTRQSKRVKPPSEPRRDYQERKLAGITRGASERAERRKLTEGDEWLAVQPWMSIQRLRRVAANRKAVFG